MLQKLIEVEFDVLFYQSVAARQFYYWKKLRKTRNVQNLFWAANCASKLLRYLRSTPEPHEKQHQTGRYFRAIVSILLHYFAAMLASAVVLIIIINYRATVMLRRQMFSVYCATPQNASPLAYHQVQFKNSVSDPPPYQTTAYYSSFTHPVAVIIFITRYICSVCGALQIFHLLLFRCLIQQVP